LQRDNKHSFVKKARKIHGNKYSYRRAIYKRSNKKIDITCKEHGLFQQTPNKHLQGQGCPICAGTYRSNTKEFIKKSISVHGNKYEYDLVDYHNAYSKVKIGCLKHGIFVQDPHDHLNGKGCPQCKHPVSKAETSWLNTIGISKENRNKLLIINKQRYVVDGYEDGTIYEFYGDYWHGNPDKFPATDINKHTGCTFGDLYNKTVKREECLKRAGFSIITMWESEYESNEMQGQTKSNLLQPYVQA